MTSTTNDNLIEYKRAKKTAAELKAVNEILMKAVIDLMKYDNQPHIKEIQLYLRHTKLLFDKDILRANKVIENGKLERSSK
jgi:hypothetical protein